ncbi:MAG: AraC family transcriptional regulator [Solobacterium sp.]|nr:AraC family transcriptional regulator [Solobacterium sp.]
MNDIIYVGKHSQTYSVSKHLHQNWELIYCTSGKGELIFPDLKLSYAEDSLTVIPPMIPHTNRSETGFTNIHVIMSDCTLNFDRPIILSDRKNEHLRNAFSAMFYYYSTNQPESVSILPIYSQLVISLVESMVNGEGKYSEIVRQITDSILKNFPDPNFDLNSSLQTFSFSTEYLKRMFKQEMGMTPRQFLTEKRLENAAKNLLTGGESNNITQIARQCGFSDPLYFSKLFKSRYGVSPKNYKKESTVMTGGDSDSTKVFI